MQTDTAAPASTLAGTARAWARRLAAITSSPRLEAELLVLQAVGLPRTALYTHPQRPMDAAELERATRLLERRLRGEPLAYVLGSWGFWDLDLLTPRGVLVPRPETECLVELVLGQLEPEAPLRVLDLGTGSGCIALALARERPRWQVTATDAYATPLETARLNARRLGLDGRLRWLQGDWYEAVRGEEPFDAIVCNPPYIRAEDACFVEEPALRFEPREALAGGPDGLQALHRVIHGAPVHLRAGGLLAVEHGWDQAQPVRTLFTHAGLTGVHTRQDLGKRDRVTWGRRP